MKYIKLFSNIDAYNSSKLILPNVSLIEDTYELKFNELINAINYSNEYLTIECIESGTIKIGPDYRYAWEEAYNNGDFNNKYYLKVSSDGINWTDITTEWDFENYYCAYITNLQQGDKLMVSAKLVSFDNVNNKYTFDLNYSADDPNLSFFDNAEEYGENGGKFIIYGNLRSIFFGDDFMNSYDYDINTFANISDFSRPATYLFGCGITSLENVICDMTIPYERIMFFANLAGQNVLTVGPTFIINSVQAGILAYVITDDKILNSIKIIGNIDSEDLFTLLDGNSILEDGNESTNNNVIIYKSPEATFENSAIIEGESIQLLPNNYIIQNIS